MILIASHTVCQRFAMLQTERKIPEPSVAYGRKQLAGRLACHIRILVRNISAPDRIFKLILIHEKHFAAWQHYDIQIHIIEPGNLLISQALIFAYINIPLDNTAFVVKHGRYHKLLTLWKMLHPQVSPVSQT